MPLPKLSKSQLDKLKEKYLRDPSVLLKAIPDNYDAASKLNLKQLELFKEVLPISAARLNDLKNRYEEEIPARERIKIVAIEVEKKRRGLLGKSLARKLYYAGWLWYGGLTQEEKNEIAGIEGKIEEINRCIVDKYGTDIKREIPFSLRDETKPIDSPSWNHFFSFDNYTNCLRDSLSRTNSMLLDAEQKMRIIEKAVPIAAKMEEARKDSLRHQRALIAAYFNKTRSLADGIKKELFIQLEKYPLCPYCLNKLDTNRLVQIRFQKIGPRSVV